MEEAHHLQHVGPDIHTQLQISPSVPGSSLWVIYMIWQLNSWRMSERYKVLMLRFHQKLPSPMPSLQTINSRCLLATTLVSYHLSKSYSQEKLVIIPILVVIMLLPLREIGGMTHLFNILIFEYLYDNWTENEPMMNPVDSILKVGVDAKASNNVGCNVSWASVQNYLFRAPTLSNVPLLTGDYNWAHNKIVPRVIQVMNKSPNPGDSLFSLGPEGNGQTFVAFHDATLDPSSGRNNNMPSFLFVQQIFYQILCFIT